jgi:hypothetical protein
MALDMKKLRNLAEQKNEDAKGSGGDFAPWLDMKEDDEFVGTVVDIRANTFDDSGKTHMFEVTSFENPDERYTLRAHKSLVSKLEKQGAAIGDVVYVKCIGQVKSQKSKFKYNDYIVAVLTEEEIADLSGGKSEAPAKKPEKKPEGKKPAEKKGSFPNMDGEDLKKLKSSVAKALEFNDGQVEMTELIRMLKSKSIKFDDEDDAKAKLSYAGFDVNDEGIVSKP